ncbi:Zinc finger A20 and AN1 domain-containing stress-associated protein 2 [Capsicum baccatum]|uniref:Zinc finger A20 and AN1 domain-containing stress-associated protein 2 n=1 Tax=Capsicum baccatum TaxID=33114 RepID=A0A2G2V805_CAPBA|nr:Zinc finger A20 and AN1 domain-containing stress-associated protein 2 [Capsicum baccatum]
MKGYDTRGGMAANVDVSTARQTISRGISLSWVDPRRQPNSHSTYSNDYKDDKSKEIESSKEIGCRAPEDPVLCINDCNLYGSATTMNMCSKFQKDMILLKKEHAMLVATSSKDVVRRSSSSDESELALAGAAVASTELV